LRLLPRGVRSLATQAARLLPVSDEKIGLDYKITRMLQGSVLDPAEAHLYWNGTFSRAESRSLLLHPNGAGEPLTLPGEGVGDLNRFLWLDQLAYLPDDILNKCDRMSMAHSIEVRPPFLDHRIVEFAATLPENMKIRGGRLKFILRELMKDRLPRSVLARRKEGFDIPAHHWLRTTLRPLLLDTLNERQRVAVVLNKFEDMNYAEIAEIMGLTSKAVKSLLSRARARLREALSGYIYMDGEPVPPAANGEEDD
jgi:asparagine synthase (glutamine-hydrolysing)